MGSGPSGIAEWQAAIEAQVQCAAQMGHLARNSINRSFQSMNITTLWPNMSTNHMRVPSSEVADMAAERIAAGADCVIVRDEVRGVAMEIKRAPVR